MKTKYNIILILSAMIVIFTIAQVILYIDNTWAFFISIAILFSILAVFTRVLVVVNELSRFRRFVAFAILVIFAMGIVWMYRGEREMSSDSRFILFIVIMIVTNLTHALLPNKKVKGWLSKKGNIILGEED